MKKWITISLCLLLMGILSACGSDTATDDSLFHLYYLDMEETSLQEEAYTPKANAADVNALVTEFVEMLGQMPETNTNVKLLPEDVSVEDYQMNGTTLTLDLSANYKSMAKEREVLVRAGLVRTFIQIDEVEYIVLKTGGEDLTDSAGNVIGALRADSFVENSGKEINSYQNVTIDLYFANETGDKLVKESRRLYYSSNVPLERVVVEQLIKGPKESTSYATLPTETKVLGVSMTEGVCYINLDKTFADQALSIQEMLPVYSIVNSIIDDCNVTKVQIAIEGETSLTFRESMKLDTFFEKNQDLVQEGS